MQIDVTELRDALAGADAPVVLDVREPWEIALCALPNSLNIPMAEIPARLAEIPRETPIAVLCHHGMRSWQVTQWLHGQGYVQAVNVEGGIDAWSANVDPLLARY